ncbi:hypothetical protein CCAND38_760010 [Capnocytophaga canis]|uniref:Uncharacterized protein n=1 Tax=Capnocytophaga canis TaxID=1848903 RepID=A0A0B7IAZ3_9FLAO|nr:hypothetical protein CCAND38_760010 [Capnocytophaga canis]CEN50973.1 hypothetical protein CCAND93_1290009 [Capnocytophaga canis]
MSKHKDSKKQKKSYAKHNYLYEEYEHLSLYTHNELTHHLFINHLIKYSKLL